MSRILLVAYAFPPYVNAQAIRWVMLVRALAARGIDTEVLSVRLPDYFTDLTDAIPAGVLVHRTWPGPLQSMGLQVRARWQADDDWFGKRHRTGVGVARRAYHFARRTGDSLLVPDLCTEWLPVAVPLARRLARSGRFDALVSTHEPGVNHFVAWAAKIASGLPWVADFADPWINQNTPRWRRALDRRVERSIFRRIDAATVSTDAAARYYDTTYAALAPTRVVRQAFDQQFVEAIGPERLAPDEAFHLFYSGSLYVGLRDPASVFAGVKLARERGLDVRLTIAGRVPDPIVRRSVTLGVGDGVQFIGIVPHARAIALQKGADALLHIDNAGTALQVPGKFYEYLGAGRPILLVRHGPAETSVAARRLIALEAGLDVPARPEAIADALMDLSRDRESGRRRAADATAAAEHTFARSADDLCQALADATSRVRAARASA